MLCHDCPKEKCIAIKIRKGVSYCSRRNQYLLEASGNLVPHPGSLLRITNDVDSGLAHDCGDLLQFRR